MLNYILCILRQRRKWKIPANVQRQSTELRTEREIFLEKRILEIEEQFRLFQAKFENSETLSKKGKGKGKKSCQKMTEEISEEVRML